MTDNTNDYSMVAMTELSRSLTYKVEEDDDPGLDDKEGEDEEENQEEEEDYEKEMFFNKWKVEEWLNRQPAREDQSDVENSEERGEPLYQNSYGYGAALANPPSYPPPEKCERSGPVKAVPIGYGIPKEKKDTQVIPNLSKTLELAGEQQGKLVKQLNDMNFPWRKRKSGKAIWVKESKAMWRPQLGETIKNKRIKGVKDIILLRVLFWKKVPKLELDIANKDPSCEVLFEPFKDIVTKTGKKVRIHSRALFVGDTLPEQVEDAVNIIKEKLRNENTNSSNINYPDEQGDKNAVDQMLPTNCVDVFHSEVDSDADLIHQAKSASLKLNAQSSADEIQRISSFLRKTRTRSKKHHTIFSLKEFQYETPTKHQSFMKKLSTNFSKWTSRAFHFDKYSRRVHPSVEPNEVLPATPSSTSSLLEQPQLQQEQEQSSNDCFLYQFMSNLVSYFQYLSRRRHLRREIQITSVPDRQSLSRFEPLRRTVGRGLPIMNEADMASHIFHKPHVCPSPHMRHCRRSHFPKMGIKENYLRGLKNSPIQTNNSS